MTLDRRDFLRVSAAVLAAGAFFIIGLLIWLLRTIKPQLVEEE